MYEALLAENQSHLQRFLAANYFAAENLAIENATSSLTWERRFAGVSPIGVATFVDAAVTGAQRRSTMMGCQDVTSTLEDAVRAISADTSAAYCRLEREVTGSEFVVGADVIETVVPRTKENPYEFVSLKHVTYRSAINVGPSKGEDYVVIETIGKDTDPDGFPFAYKMVRSVDMPGVMAHVDGDEAYGMTPSTATWRGTLHTFMLILSETETPGQLRMMVWCDMDLPHAGTDALFSSVSSLHDALSLGLRYRRCIENNFVRSVKDSLADPRAMRTSQAWLPIIKSRRQKCQVCDRKLGLLNRKMRYSCGICKATLCGTCGNVTDTHTWRLCGCCYARNQRLFSRQINAKLVGGSGLNRLGYLAKCTQRVVKDSVTNRTPRLNHSHSSHGLTHTSSSIYSTSRLSSSAPNSLKEARPSYSSSCSTNTSPDFSRPSLSELDLINEGSEELARRHNQSMMEEKYGRCTADTFRASMESCDRVITPVEHSVRWHNRR